MWTAVVWEDRSTGLVTRECGVSGARRIARMMGRVRHSLVVWYGYVRYIIRFGDWRNEEEVLHEY